MQEEMIVYVGLDPARDDDITVYGLYDPETGQYYQIDEKEYESLVRRASLLNG